MSEDIEIEVRHLVRQLTERATRGGGMDGQTYEALTAATAALTFCDVTGQHQSPQEALYAMRARLRACGVGLPAEVA